MGADQAWVQVIVQLGSFGLIAVFFIAYLPKIANRFLEALEKTNDNFDHRLNDILKAFRDEVESVRGRADSRAERMVAILVQRLDQMASKQEEFLQRLERIHSTNP